VEAGVYTQWPNSFDGSASNDFFLQSFEALKKKAFEVLPSKIEYLVLPSFNFEWYDSLVTTILVLPSFNFEMNTVTLTTNY
jgi:hypothetical protein